VIHFGSTTSGVASRERDAAGRFVAGTDLRTRYAQIATVLRAADSDEPQRVSTRAFDAARESAGQPSLPAAKNLAELLGMPWPAVKAVALDATRDEVRTYKSRHRRDPRGRGEMRMGQCSPSSE